jgi:hypothetical protein
MYSSQVKSKTNLNCGILTAAIILSHSTDNCSHEVFNSHDQIFFNFEPSAAVSHPELTRKRASVSHINSWSDTRETLQLLRHCWNAWRHCWRGHVTLPRSCVIQVFIMSPGNKKARRGDARRCATRHGSARLGTEKTPLRLLLRNCGSVFRCYSSCMA